MAGAGRRGGRHGCDETDAAAAALAPAMVAHRRPAVRRNRVCAVRPAVTPEREELSPGPSLPADRPDPQRLPGLDRRPRHPALCRWQR
jgi:hypothetical protein